MEVPALDLAHQINEAIANSERLADQAVVEAARAGQLMIDAKAAVPHGQWGQWIQDNCNKSERQAQKYMRLARELPKLDSNQRAEVLGLSINGAVDAIAEKRPSGAGLPAPAKTELDRLRAEAEAAQAALRESQRAAWVEPDLGPKQMLIVGDDTVVCRLGLHSFDPSQSYPPPGSAVHRYKHGERAKNFVAWDGDLFDALLHIGVDVSRQSEWRVVSSNLDELGLKPEPEDFSGSLHERVGFAGLASLCLHMELARRYFLKLHDELQDRLESGKAENPEAVKRQLDEWQETIDGWDSAWTDELLVFKRAA